MATLVYSDADGVDRSFALGVDPVLVGRAPECAIRSEDPRVSRQHARFYVDGGALWIEDLGSQNGIYVGPNKVQRAPVPTGEIILVGSLIIRLLPASGTLPPPMGLHGTLAISLDLERKARAAVEEERDAFARRVNELHQQIAATATAAAKNVPSTTLRDGSGVPGGLAAVLAAAGDTQPAMAAEAVRMRDEAEAKAAALENALAAMQDEMMVLRNAAGASDVGADLVRLRDELAAARARAVALELDAAQRAEWSSNLDVESSKLVREVARLQGAIDESEAARSVAEHTAAEATLDAQRLREELDNHRRTSHSELEGTRVELAKTREEKMMAETVAGVAVAEKLAEADIVVMSLQRDLAAARATVVPDHRMRELTELNASIIGRAEKVEKDLAAAQIRAQGAERNLSHASAMAAKAEGRAAQLEQQLADSDARVKSTEEEAATARERITALETRLGAGDAPVQAAEARAAKLAAELAELTSQFETRRDRLVELEAAVTAAQGVAQEAETRAATAKAEVASAAQKLTEADQRAKELQTKLDSLGKVDSAIAAAAKARQEAAALAQSATETATAAERRAEDAEKRASAADTMAKAMAKDVAEALRRAADADTRARTVSRELDNAHRRADKAEAVSAEVATSMGDSQRRIAEAEARVAQIQQELEVQLATTQQELGGKLKTTQSELGGKLEAVQRELAAEHATSLAMVDRKTQLEREIAEARTQLPALVARAEAAEKKLLEAEVQIETLQDRVLDLESGMAVSETAQHASLDEAREEIRTLTLALAEAQAIVGGADNIAVELRNRVDELEKQLAEAEQSRGVAEGSLHQAQTEIENLLRAAEQRSGSAESAQERLEDALARAGEAERKIDALTARAEAADLAIGRAGALQRQLDEAITKLAWLERDAASKTRESSRALEQQSDAIVADRIAAAEERAKEAEGRVHDAELRVADAERRAALAKDKAGELAERITELERRAQQSESSVRVNVDGDRRAREAEARSAEADARAQVAERTAQQLQHQLLESQNRVGALEREVATADNVRSFAAETEREIAQLQREVRDARAKLTQMTLERDRLAADLRDARGDSETTNRRAPIVDPHTGGRRTPPPQRDPEATATLDVAQIEKMIARTTELEKKVIALERESAGLRKQLNESEQRLRDAIDRADDDDDSDATRTGSQLPIVLAEHVSMLEESIDSLRANMRAASDETAMMEQSDSVTTISSAVSQAAEHIERARATVRALAAAIGMNS
jgi:chromosome segregation ATPase